jgi:outer membrane protein assembly factor BamB
MRHTLNGALILLTWVVPTRADDVDPAPPRVNALPAATEPGPSDYDRVTFHGAPKPLPAGAVTHDWKTFLGPTHNGISTETKLLKKWPNGGPKPVWELSKGIAYTSPSIHGDYLVFSHRVDDEVLVECLHPATGQQYWQFKYPSEYRDRYGYGSGPRASAVIDSNRVYILGVEGEFFCLELKTGRVIWQRNINRDFGVSQDFFGTVGTPLLQGNLLILNVGGRQGPCVVAFNKMTGRAVWTAGKNKWGPSYASPIPGMIHGQPRVFVFAGGDSDPAIGGLLSINPMNGAVDFEFPWRSSKYESVNASCPVVIGGDRVFVSATYRKGSALLQIKPDFSHSTLWTMSDREHNTDDDQLGIHWNTPIYKDGHLYAFDGRNEPDASLVCVNVKTGKVVWRTEPEWEDSLELNGETQKLTLSTLRGCLMHVDGQFLCVGELGHLLWLDLSPAGYRELQRTWLFASRETWAPPVISRGLLYMTQNQRDLISRKGPRLICYDFRAVE